MEIQKELKALTKELRPKKKKEKMEELEEEKEEEKVEPKDKNDVLESYHKEKKRYAEVKAAKPIPKQKASEICSCHYITWIEDLNLVVFTRPAERSRPWLYSPNLSRNCLGSNMATMMRKKTMRLRRPKKMTKRLRMMRRSLETTG